MKACPSLRKWAVCCSPTAANEPAGREHVYVCKLKEFVVKQVCVCKLKECVREDVSNVWICKERCRYEFELFRMWICVGV